MTLPPGGLGAYHGSELSFIFNQRFGDDLPPYFHGPTYPLTVVERGLAATMSSYWAEFAVSGRPSSGNATPWPSYNASADDIMLLDVAPQMDENVYAARCAFWDATNDKYRWPSAAPTPTPPPVPQEPVLPCNSTGISTTFPGGHGQACWYNGSGWFEGRWLVHITGSQCQASGHAAPQQSQFHFEVRNAPISQTIELFRLDSGGTHPPWFLCGGGHWQQFVNSSGPRTFGVFTAANVWIGLDCNGTGPPPTAPGAPLAPLPVSHRLAHR
jgi:hypothetical protein